MAYTRLTQDKRFYLEKRLAFGDKVKDIAIVLGRHKYSLYREIKHNTDKSFGFYSGLIANNIASDRNKSAKRKVSFFENEDNKEALKILNEQLVVRSSPEQIASIICGDDSFDGYVSHTTIYKYIHADRLKGGKLHLHLRRRGVKYRTISQKTEQACIKNKQSIETREKKEELYKEPCN
jgi:transposase, IS30 family